MHRLLGLSEVGRSSLVIREPAEADDGRQSAKQAVHSGSTMPLARSFVETVKPRACLAGGPTSAEAKQ
jgi:hypothetical protein